MLTRLLPAGDSIGQRIHGAIHWETMPPGEMDKALAARDDKKHRHSKVSLEMFELDKIFWALEDTRRSAIVRDLGSLSPACQHDDDGLFLLRDDAKDGLLLIVRFYIKHTKIAGIASFHRSLTFLYAWLSSAFPPACYRRCAAGL